MAVVLMINIPGATQEQYDQARDALDPLGQNQISHQAGPTADGWGVVDVWESRADFDRFLEGPLGAELQRAGFPEPQITEFSLYAEERR